MLFKRARINRNRDMADFTTDDKHAHDGQRTSIDRIESGDKERRGSGLDESNVR